MINCINMLLISISISAGWSPTGTFVIPGRSTRVKFSTKKYKENMKLAPVGVSYGDDFLILYPVYMLTGPFYNYFLLVGGTLHVDKIPMWFKIATITHALRVPVHRQSGFTPKQVVVLRLHDTVARFHSGVKFSSWYNNRSELTTGWLAPAWHFVVGSCKRI